jgi:N-acetylglucosaminyldiphosphoundecaprenol N-acetyl-beta-D-mannosaminyltransferase
MGLGIHATTERECVDLVAAEWAAGRGGWLHTVNLDHLRMINAGGFFPGKMPRAEICVCDGAPLLWASRLKGTPLPERIAGSDLIRSLTQAAAATQGRVFFLGGNPGTADGAAAQLQKEFPGFVVAGTLCPEFGFEKKPDALKKITQALREAQPDLVFVALGAPKSERLIQDWKKQTPSTWWVAIGISFSFVTGEVKRAPRWMQVSGLEWIHRLTQEPKRLARRYLIQGLPFGMRLFWHCLRQRFARSKP